DRAQVAYGDFGVVGIERDLGAQVGAVNDADVLLGRTDVAGILESDPVVAGFKQHGQHLAPQCGGGNFFEQRQLAAFDLGFVAQVGLFEVFAVFVVQVGGVGW